MPKSFLPSNYWSPNLLPLGVILALLLLTAGCTSMRYSGAPPPAYNLDEDLKQLAEHFRTATALSTYYALEIPTPKDRNKVISARLVMYDLQYLKWLRTVNADKQLLDTATDVLIMSLNIAGTALGGVTTKTILAATSAAVGGAKVSIDKNYYYEKTVAALVSTMNAQRKVVRYLILAGMDKNLEQYPLALALCDLHDYYQAGTFMGALSEIVSYAGSKEREADKEIKMLLVPTAEEVAARDKVKIVLEKLNATKVSDEDLTKLYSALKSLGVTGVNTQEDARTKLLMIWQRDKDVPAKTAVEIINALKNAKYPVD